MLVTLLSRLLQSRAARLKRAVRRWGEFVFETLSEGAGVGADMVVGIGGNMKRIKTEDFFKKRFDAARDLASQRIGSSSRGSRLRASAVAAGNSSSVPSVVSGSFAEFKDAGDGKLRIGDLV